MSLNLKPTHKSVVAYYESLRKFEQLGIKHESAVRSAFQELLETCARQFDWKLVPEYAIKRKGKMPLKADGALLDPYGLNHGIWEAKDAADDLEKEIQLKFSVGYPRDNILFQEPGRAILYQQGERIYEADLKKPDALIHALQLFLYYAPPAIAEWEKAVEQFKDRVPEIGQSLKILIEKERQTNKKFIAAFEDFCSLCRGSLNPNISVEAVEEMIIQHILTERIFRKIFDVADFISRNVIAQEIEKVITALNSRVFSRDDFSKSLEHFYGAIENAAATITDFNEKQTFLNTVYERFFQGFCVEVADTHGIVYTPQPLVNFMVASVEHILKKEFDKSLADKEVHILDPFTGTGNFIVNIMRHIPKSALPHKFAHELHCNEVMLLPYYVASMNIEHAYWDATGKYESFEGICLVDTFETAEESQGDFERALFNEANAARVERQRKAPIRVVIANPPYNAGQLNENDNNKNRKYPKLDKRVQTSYVADSAATLKRKYNDPYIKAIRYASDRIGETGIVCYVNNNSFIHDTTFDGIRKHLEADFDLIYVLDLGVDIREHPELSGTTHNVFGIQVAVSINVFVKLPRLGITKRKANIRYGVVPSNWRREKKLEFLEEKKNVINMTWQSLTPNKRYDWLTSETDEEFRKLVPMGTKATRSGSSTLAIFGDYGPGISTNRDTVVYDFEAGRLAKRVEEFVDDYNAEVERWQKKGKPKDIDNFVHYDKVKWSRDLKLKLSRELKIRFDSSVIRDSLYRPFTVKKLYSAPIAVDRLGPAKECFASAKAEKENIVLCASGPGNRQAFGALAAKLPTSLDLAFEKAQCFALYTYPGDGKTRHNNITRSALTLFHIFYDDSKIAQEDIFHYVYAMLHHPAYRIRYAENLKRELPRIPFTGVVANAKANSSVQFFSASAAEKVKKDGDSDHNPKASAKLFHDFAAAGKKLADLHINYESAREFKLKRVENKEVKLDWRVESMKLSKDKSSLIYNDFLTLEGIPPQVFEYRLGNRSALDWIIDQYRVERDGQGNITSDPNRMDDEEYIVRLIGQVITVSLETQEIVKSLPAIQFPD